MLMPSPIYQNMVNLIVGFPFWRRPSILILGWCILLRLYLNEEIQPPLFATTTYRVFILHELHYMFRSYMGHLQVYHVYKMLKIVTITLTDQLILYQMKCN
jgi:hypothetical protein